MSIYIDADAFALWERKQFDLAGFMEARPNESFAFPAVVWQQIVFGAFAWSEDRARKRTRSLLILGGLAVAPFHRAAAVRAARLEAEMKLNKIGFADFQIAATALENGAQLLTFNRKHFQRVAGLGLVTVCFSPRGWGWH